MSENINSPLNQLNSIICCISNDIYIDPVILSDGHTYERKEIEKWLRNNNTSPLTNEILVNKNVITNHVVKSIINELKSIENNKVNKSTNKKTIYEQFNKQTTSQSTNYQSNHSPTQLSTNPTNILDILSITEWLINLGIPMDDANIISNILINNGYINLRFLAQIYKSTCLTNSSKSFDAFYDVISSHSDIKPGFINPIIIGIKDLYKIFESESEVTDNNNENILTSTSVFKLPSSSVNSHPLTNRIASIDFDKAKIDGFKVLDKSQMLSFECPHGPRMIYTSEVLNNTSSQTSSPIVLKFHVSGNTSWSFGVIPESHLNENNYLHEKGKMGFNSKGTLGGVLPTYQMHDSDVEIILSLTNLEIRIGRDPVITQPMVETLPVRLALCGFTSTIFGVYK